MQLNKNHEIPPSTRDEALFPCSASRAILSSLSKVERRLHYLYATQEFPQDTRHNSRRTTSFLPQLENSPVFPTSSQDEDRFPTSTREESRLSPPTSTGGLSQLLKLKRNPVVPDAVQKDNEFPSNLR